MDVQFFKNFSFQPLGTSLSPDVVSLYLCWTPSGALGHPRATCPRSRLPSGTLPWDSSLLSPRDSAVSPGIRAAARPGPQPGREAVAGAPLARGSLSCAACCPGSSKPFCHVICLGLCVYVCVCFSGKTVNLEIQGNLIKHRTCFRFYFLEAMGSVLYVTLPKRVGSCFLPSNVNDSLWLRITGRRLLFTCSFVNS